jgi:hypothetical protein
MDGIRLPFEWHVWQEAGYTEDTYREAVLLFNEEGGPCPGHNVKPLDNRCRYAGCSGHSFCCKRSCNSYGMHRCPKQNWRSVGPDDPTGMKQVAADAERNYKRHQELQALADWRDQAIREATADLRKQVSDASWALYGESMGR